MKENIRKVQEENEKRLKKLEEEARNESENNKKEIKSLQNQHEYKMKEIRIEQDKEKKNTLKNKRKLKTITRI